jgi:putative flippase GtrA
MEHVKHLLAFRVARFTLAGAVNTTVNFAMLNLMFYGVHLNKIVAIMIATACAIAVSFVLNRSFVFRDKEKPAAKLARFIVVSVLGVFLVQTSVYTVCITLLHGHEGGIARALYSIAGYRFSDSFVAINLSNTIASVAVLFWNYNGYRLFVFTPKLPSKEIAEGLGAESA